LAEEYHDNIQKKSQDLQRKHPMKTVKHNSLYS